jgi:hypothetical protein
VYHPQLSEGEPAAENVIEIFGAQRQGQTHPQSCAGKAPFCDPRSNSPAFCAAFSQTSTTYRPRFELPISSPRRLMSAPLTSFEGKQHDPSLLRTHNARVPFPAKCNARGLHQPYRVGKSQLIARSMPARSMPSHFTLQPQGSGAVEG